MTSRSSRERAAIGVTVKSGWASAVLIAPAATELCVLDSRRLDLSDPSNPAARQPYHDGFGTARAAGSGLAELVASIERFGSASTKTLLDDWSKTADIAGVGVVVGSLIDPDQIGNSHIRIHAMEGRLFRTVVIDAATRAGLPVAIHRERDLVAEAMLKLDRAESSIRAAVEALKKRVGIGAWRAEHKAATLAAWLMLARVAESPTELRGPARP
jgi:hypothetical protein